MGLGSMSCKMRHAVPLRFWRKTLCKRGRTGYGFDMNDAAKMEIEEVQQVELAELRREHRDLDDAIEALQETGRADTLRLRRLKKQKLALKDRIRVLEDRLTPDIIA